MMSMKKILVALMSMTLLFTTIPVSAAEDDGIQITCNKLTDQDEPYTSTDEDGKRSQYIRCQRWQDITIRHFICRIQDVLH